MKTIADVDLQDQRVLVRVDFNVPLDEHGNITDDARIAAVLPTLSYALSQQAKLIVASHLGRPKGKENPALSLSPVAAQLSHLLQQEVTMAPDCIGPEVSALVSAMKSGEVVLLENLRFHPEEQENDAAFSEELSSLCDIYVNDAFAVSHRSHASVEGVTRYAPISVAGFLLRKELQYLDKAIANPQRPLIVIIGGSKVSSKLGALANMIATVDAFIIGGAMANTFLRSEGVDVGKSKVEEDLLESARSIIHQAGEKGVKVYLPVDAVVASRFDSDAENRTVSIGEIPADWTVLDIGPETIQLYTEALEEARTIVWNGPMGVFEMPPYAEGTMAIARCVARSKALSIAGGGDTDAALHQFGETDNISYLSTGGGAFLSLLEGNRLPAVDALTRGAESIRSESDYAP
ncbi:MAG: phosphoglycerate kinase [Desulfobacterales bacterium]